MILVVVLACFLALGRPAAAASAPLPVLRAHSPLLDVRDGDQLRRGAWRADPAVALDRYDARRADGLRRVTFLSDVDSLAFDVRPGTAYDFVVLLDDRDSCRTRLSTLRQGCRRVSTGADTIPITIAHGKLHLRGTFGDSQPLDLIFDTGADQCVLYPSALRKGARPRFDGAVDNAGTGGSTRRQTSSDNRLAIGGLRWEHEPVLFIEKQSDRSADGIVGYPVFEDRALEFDYDRMVLVVHDTLPPELPGFSRVSMSAAGSLTAVSVELLAAGRSIPGSFILDTAGSGTLNVYAGFATAHGLYAALPRLGTSRSHGVGSRTVLNQVSLVPEIRVAGFTLRDVPVHLEQSAGDGAREQAGTLDMDVLTRFNGILDYPHGAAYFRPNRRFAVPFRRRNAVPLGAAGASAAVAAAAVVVVASRRGTGTPRASGASSARPGPM